MMEQNVANLATRNETIFAVWTGVQLKRILKVIEITGWTPFENDVRNWLGYQ